MSAAAEKIRALKLVLGAQIQAPQKEFWEAPQFDGGIPKGVVVELIGNAKVQWLIKFLAGHPEFKIFWAEKEQSILPTSLKQRGLDLAQVTFASLGEDMVAPLRKVLQSQSFQIVVAPTLFKEIRIFQAFQLFTEKNDSTLFLLGEKEPADAWPISLQLEINETNANQYDIQVIKQKHGKDV